MSNLTPYDRAVLMSRLSDRMSLLYRTSTINQKINLRSNLQYRGLGCSLSGLFFSSVFFPAHIGLFTTPFYCRDLFTNYDYTLEVVLARGIETGDIVKTDGGFLIVDAIKRNYSADTTIKGVITSKKYTTPICIVFGFNNCRYYEVNPFMPVLIRKPLPSIYS